MAINFVLLSDDIEFLVIRKISGDAVDYRTKMNLFKIMAVLSVVIIGYFIKYLVGVIKANKERRRIIKLKLNEDIEDDGTN